MDVNLAVSRLMIMGNLKDMILGDRITFVAAAINPHIAAGTWF
jgi:hypothetical protein